MPLSFHRPLAVGSQSWETLDGLHCFVRLPAPTLRSPHPHLKATSLHSFLPRRGLSCPNPSPAPGSLPEKTPFLSGEQLGRVGEGRAKSAVIPARRQGTVSEPECSSSHLHPASVYTQGLGAGTLIQLIAINLRELKCRGLK